MRRFNSATIKTVYYFASAIPAALWCTKCVKCIPQFLAGDGKLMVFKGCSDCNGRGVVPIPLEELA